MKFNPSTSQRDQDPRRASVWRRLRQHISGTKLRVPILWLRHRGFRSSDVFLGSYPRSGSTWLRFTLFEMLTGRTANFESVNTSLRGPGTHRLALPVLPLLLMVTYLFRDPLKRVFGPELGIFLLIVGVIGALNWMALARLVRAGFLSIKQKEFVEAARCVGASNRRHRSASRSRPHCRGLSGNGGPLRRRFP